jgi:hypothetical protein
MYARKKSKIVKGEYKIVKQKYGSAKPTPTEGIYDLPINDCELQETIKQIKNIKSHGEDQIFKACRERSENLNMHVVSKNLGNRYCALPLEKSNSGARTENR